MKDIQKDSHHSSHILTTNKEHINQLKGYIRFHIAGRFDYQCRKCIQGVLKNTTSRLNSHSERSQNHIASTNQDQNISSMRHGKVSTNHFEGKIPYCKVCMSYRYMSGILVLLSITHKIQLFNLRHNQVRMHRMWIHQKSRVYIQG